MSSHTDIPAQPAAPSGMDVARISGLIAHLETKLSKVPADAPGAQDLRDEIAALKNVLATPDFEPHHLTQALHGVREMLGKAKDTVVGEAVRDSTFFADIGRILGLQ
jgi:hypothetical protein